MLNALRRNLSEVHWIIAENEFSKLGLSNGDYFMVAKQWNATFDNCIIFFIKKVHNNFERIYLKIKNDEKVPFKYYTIISDD